VPISLFLLSKNARGKTLKFLQSNNSITFGLLRGFYQIIFTIPIVAVNIKKVIFILQCALSLWTGLLFSGHLNAQEQIPQQAIVDDLGNKYYDALDFLTKNTWMSDTLMEYKINPDLAYGIVFPGLANYSAIRDIMETGASRTLYVQRGRKYAHFTIGRFQMKPSFAELVERNVTRQKLTKYEFNLKNSVQARSQRVKRLDSPEWQLRYLVFFVRLMDKRFAHVEWKSEDDKVRFYATAFDVGYNRDERTIRRMMNPRTRYSKPRKSKVKYRYGDVAMYFFQNDGYRFRVEELETSDE
jgi:hypothetical protein